MFCLQEVSICELVNMVRMILVNSQVMSSCHVTLLKLVFDVLLTAANSCPSPMEIVHNQSLAIMVSLLLILAI